MKNVLLLASIFSRFLIFEFLTACGPVQDQELIQNPLLYWMILILFYTYFPFQSGQLFGRIGTNRARILYWIILILFWIIPIMAWIFPTVWLNAVRDLAVSRPSSPNLSPDSNSLFIFRFGIPTMLILFHLGYSRGHRDRIEHGKVSIDGEKVLIKPYCAPEIESYMKLVDELARTKEYEAAIENLREAIRICPTSAVAHNNLGCVLGNLRRFEEAEKEFVEALELSAADPYAPNPYVDASNNLALLRGYKLKFNFGDDVKLLWKASRSRKKRSG